MCGRSDRVCFDEALAARRGDRRHVVHLRRERRSSPPAPLRTEPRCHTATCRRSARDRAPQSSALPAGLLRRVHHARLLSAAADARLPDRHVGSMTDTQMARAVSELAGLTRQLRYGPDVVVMCCDAAVHSVKQAFTGTPVELYGAVARISASDYAPSSSGRSRPSTCWWSSATAARRGRKSGRPSRSSRSGSATARCRRGEL